MSHVIIMVLNNAFLQKNSKGKTDVFIFSFKMKVLNDYVSCVTAINDCTNDFSCNTIDFCCSIKN